MIPQTIDLRKVVTITIVSIITIIVLSLWITNSIYKFTVNGSDSYSLQGNSGGEVSDIFSLFGYSLVPKSVDFIEIRDGSSLSRHSLTDKPWFSIKSESIAIQDQRAVDKVGMNGTGCDLATTTGSTVYSYNCNDLNSPMLAFANRQEGEHDNSHAYLTGDTFVVDREPYRDGMLIITIEESQEIVLSYVSVTGKVISDIKLGSIEATDNLYRLFTNTGSEKFVLINTNKGILYNFDKGLRDNYQQTNLDEYLKTDKDSFVVDCSLNDKQTACFIATSPDEDESDKDNQNDSEFHSKSPTEGILLLKSSADDITNYHINHGFETICLGKDSITALDHESKIYHLSASDPSKAYLLDTDARVLDCSGSATAYTKSSSVFKVSGATSKLLFQVGRFSLSNVQTQFDGRILFNSFVNSTDDEASFNTLHSYAVDSDQLISDTSRRLENTLPYTTTSLPILEMDYDDKFIYIRPQASVTSDHSSGRLIIDPDSLAATKRQIEQQLSEDGILERLEIVYY